MTKYVLASEFKQYKRDAGSLVIMLYGVSGIILGFIADIYHFAFLSGGATALGVFIMLLGMGVSWKTIEVTK